MTRQLSFICGGAALLSAASFFARPLAADADGSIVHAQRKIDDARVRVIEYDEQFGPVVPEWKDRNWRDVICVEVARAAEPQPRIVWRQCNLGRYRQLGPDFSPRSFVLSEAANGRLVMAYCNSRTIFAALIELGARLDPLPDKAPIDPQTLFPDWKNSPDTTIPKLISPPGASGVGLIQALGKADIGMDLRGNHELSLATATKKSSGWRIEAAIHDTHEIVKRRMPNGSIISGRNPVPVLRFAVLLDEECKSYKIEVEGNPQTGNKSK